MNAPPSIHPSEQTLSSYGLGKLDDGSAEAVNQHLERCPVCRKRVAEMSADSFLERVRDAQARPDSPVPLISSTAGLSMLASGSASSAPPPTSSLPPGLADHPDYEILRELGQGGMGVVYLAENKVMGRKEVLKVVGIHLINRRGVLDRFLGEIRHAAQLHHPNVVTAYSVLRLGESLVLAMEYVEGLDLAKMVKARGPLPVANACNYVHQAALGLQHAHEHGMVHRDIKPGNLMLARQGNRAVVKVLDFGLAKVSREVPADGTLTFEGQMLGTPDFIAPEQISDARRADIRADIYSLGCTLYCLLTGGPPFQGTSLYDILQAHHSRDALPLNLARPEVPVELAALVGKMMAKEPERRFQTPAEVGKALMPFFKKGNAALVGSKPDLSQVAQPEAKQATPGGRSVSAQPSTDKAPVHLPKDSAGTPRHDPLWASLIELEETESGSRPAAPGERRTRATAAVVLASDRRSGRVHRDPAGDHHSHHDREGPHHSRRAKERGPGQDRRWHWGIADQRSEEPRPTTCERTVSTIRRRRSVWLRVPVQWEGPQRLEIASDTAGQLACRKRRPDRLRSGSQPPLHGTG